MAGPTVNIKILADASAAVSTLDKASGKVSKMGGAMKALPIAAAGAALYSMGKAAVEDAAGQATLAKSLSNATGATKGQTAAVEDWITKTAAASGVADDQLRPALGNLARATGDVGKAQGALSQALDVSAATGKPVEAVAAAMAKGYAGNTTALGKLVPGLDRGVLATKDMAKISAELARLTGGASADAAGTAAGQYKRMTLAVDETQEAIGGALLPALSSLAPFLLMVATFLQKNADVVGPLVIGLGALAAVVWAVNAAMAANPVTLVIIGIAALIAVVVIAYKRVAFFRNAVQAYFRVLLAVWTAVARGVMVAVRAIAAAAMWLWKNAIKPAIDGIVWYVQFFWRTVGAVKDKVVSAWQTLWRAAVSLKDKIVSAFHALADAAGAPFRTLEDIISGALGWLDKLLSKITGFHVPKWLTSIMGKVGATVGLAAGPQYVPAPTVRRGGAGSARTTAATPAGAASGAGATMSRLTGAGTQVVVQVSDRRMVDLVNVQLRDAATATKRDLTRRQVVIV